MERPLLGRELRFSLLLATLVLWGFYFIIHLLILGPILDFTQNLVVIIVSLVVAGVVLYGLGTPSRETGRRERTERRKRTGSKEESRWRRPEFLLVVVMLIALTSLIIVVLNAPAPASLTSDNTTAKAVLDYRQSVLAVILTAFGAWIGAGAAYYFGKEALRGATKGMLDMRAMSTRELLRKKPVREIPPRTLDWGVQRSDPLLRAWRQLEKSPSRWFMPVFKHDRVLDRVIHEEAVYRYAHEVAPNVDDPGFEPAMKKKENNVEALLKWVDTKEAPSHITDEDLRQRWKEDWSLRMKDIAIRVSMDQNVADVSDRIDRKKVYVAIVVDEEGMAHSYITTSDIRSMMLQLS